MSAPVTSIFQRPLPPGAGARILVVDDHADIRDPMAQLLARHGFGAATARDGTELRQRLAAGEAHDLILLDVMLPGEDGIALCRHVQQRTGTPVILLTAMGRPADRVHGLESGADDYVVKPFDPAELLARIRTVLRRSRRAAAAPAAPSRRLGFDGWVFDPDRRELHDPAGRLVELSAAELRLLHAFVRRPHQVLSRELLLELTGDGEADVFDRSIDSQVSRLRRKLEADPRRPRLIKTAWGAGYLLATGVAAC
ncbi:response regulator transcription factor [Xylophilus sp.]|uniref:response regulator transcription factor n=1 Tax=Xylophilus sp. TaxID=2653893 RepID=UPI0013BD3719|nr:response regulator transcription factor [Xylophilus sp.]KAF1044714.1 MAG: Transcriptional regulatory protein OmpR [Xylophilus sp.]